MSNKQVPAVAENVAIGNSNNEQFTEDNNVDYKVLFEDVKKESIIRKEKIKEILNEKTELETRLKSFDDMVQKEKENKLKENEDYKSLLELKEKQIAKLKLGYQPIGKELKELRGLKNKIEVEKKTRRENLLNEIKTISQNNKNESYFAIAEALPDNEKLELFLNSISQVEKKSVPVYNVKQVASPRPAGEAIKANSILDMQRLFKENPAKYQEFINNKKRK
jgi:hypothetical protein